VDLETTPAGSDQGFDFTLSGNSVNQVFELRDDDDPQDSGPLLPTSENGTYSVSAPTPENWNDLGSSCSDGSPPLEVDLAPDETVTCTFIFSEIRPQLIYENGFEEP